MLSNSPGEVGIVAVLSAQRPGHEVVVSVDGRALARVRLDPEDPSTAEVAIRDPDTGEEVERDVQPSPGRRGCTRRGLAQVASGTADSTDPSAGGTGYRYVLPASTPMLGAAAPFP